MVEDEQFFEDDEDIMALLERIGGMSGVTMPSAAFLRQVRSAVAYSYEGGGYPDDMPESVANYVAVDGGLLNTLNLAVLLLDERELAEHDAGLVDKVARLLAQQNSAHADGDWDEEKVQGWASGEARRQAYREMAFEILRAVIPPLMATFASQAAEQLLPQFREIVGRYRGPSE